MENQLTLDDVLSSMEVEVKCCNCKHWTLLPLADQREGWGIKGQCAIAQSERWDYEDIDYWTSCPEFKAWEEEPEWKKQLWDCKNVGFMIHIKEELLDIEIDLWNKKIFNKAGIEIKGYEKTFR